MTRHHRCLLVLSLLALAGASRAVAEDGLRWNSEPRRNPRPQVESDVEQVSYTESDDEPVCVGTLKKAPAGARGAFPYALVGPNGEFRYYVLAKDEEQLERLVNRRVGLIGNLQKIPGDNVQLLHVEEVRDGADDVGEHDSRHNSRGVDDQRRGSYRTAQHRPRDYADRAVRRASFDDGPGTRRVGPPAPRRMSSRGASAEGDVEIIPAPEESSGPRRGGRVEWQPGRPETIPHESERIYGGPMPGGPMHEDEGYADEGYEGYIDDGMFGDEGYGPGRPRPFNRWWVRAEYLHWWTKGMDIPPLVTTSPAGTAQANAGVLGETGAEILFGNEEINDDSRSGGRIRFGVWLGRRQRLGLVGEYFALGTEETTFIGASGGTPILARPFYDAAGATESAELIAFPGLVAGSVTVDASSDLKAAGARLRLNICECGCVCYDECDRVQQGSRGVRVDLLGGFRYLELSDELLIREDLTSLNPNAPGSLVVQDQFDTNNQFTGGEIGFLVEMRRNRWTLELIGKLAAGNTRQEVTINGSTAITEGGVTETSAGGILAQRTNIGTYSRDQFSVVPELGLTLGFDVTRRFRILGGYSCIYWSRVARAGDQIDLDVNPNLFPPEQVPLTGPLRPQFAFVDTDFWAHGVNVGAELRW